MFRGWRHLTAILVGALIAGCGSGAFVQLVGDDYPFPPKKVLKGAVAARIGGSAADTLAANLKELLPGLIGTNEAGWACASLDDLLNLNSINLPLQLGPFTSDIGVRELGICIDLKDLQVEFISGSDPAALRLSVSHARLGFDGQPVIFGTIDFSFEDVSAACRLDNDLPGPQPHVADVSFTVVMTLAVDTQGAFFLTTDLEALEIHDVGITVIEDCSLAECSDPNPGDIGSPCLECGVCDIGEFGADLFELVHALLGDLLDPVIAVVIDTVSEPLLDALLNGRPLNIAAGISLSNVLGALTESARTTTALGALLKLAPDGFAVTGPSDDVGLEVRLDGGTAPDTIHDCVGNLGPGPAFAPGIFPNLALPLPDNTPYELAIGVSQALLNQTIWSLYGTGALCLRLTSREIADLTGGALRLDAATLDPLVPGLARLAGPTATIRLRIQPTLTTDDFPIVVLRPDIEATPLQLRLPSMRIAVDAFVDGNYMEIVALDTQAMAFVGVVAIGTGPDATLQLSIGDIVLSKVIVSGGEAFAGAELGAIVELAVELLVQVLQSASALSFALDPSALEGFLGDLPVELSLIRVAPGGPGADWLLIHLGLQAAQKPGARRVRTDGLPWREVAPSSNESPSAAAKLAGPHRLQWSDSGVAKSAPAARTTSPPEVPRRQPGPSGCSTANQPTSLGFLSFIFIGLILCLRRRWMLIVIALVALGCAEETDTHVDCGKRADCPSGYTCDPISKHCITEARCAQDSECCPGLTCFEGGCRLMAVCSIETGCSGDDKQCDNGICISTECTDSVQCVGQNHACIGGRCSPVQVCGGCGTGVCEPVTQRCLDVCPDLTCPPGQAAIVDNGNALRGLTCDLATAECRCVDLPALAPPMPTAWPSAITLDTGERAVVGRDQQYGDLALRVLTSPIGRAIAGIPQLPPTADVDGPRGGIVEPGPDVGRYAAAVSVPGGFVAVAHDEANLGLRVIEASNAGAVGASYMLDGGSGGYGADLFWRNGVLHATWFSNLGGLEALRYGRASQLGRTDHWTIDTVNGSAPIPLFETPCPTACGVLQTCALTPNAGCVTPDLIVGCNPPCDRSRLCVDGQCVTQLRHSLGVRPWLDEPGSETAVVVIGQEVIIGWYSRPLGAALLSRTNGSGFDTVTVAGRDGADVGRSMTLASGPFGELAMAYQNASHDRLEVHYGVTTSALIPVRMEPGGNGIDLAFSASGRLIVAHGTSGGATVEVWIGPTDWVRHVPFSTGYVGRFNAIWPTSGGATIGTVRDELGTQLVPNPSLVTADITFQ